MNFSLIGTTPQSYVPHGGGSCQVALSYDSGKTWSTIWSYMGGCVLDKTTYDVVIPPEAPSGEVLFAWDWFNLQVRIRKNREARVVLWSVSDFRAGQP